MESIREQFATRRRSVIVLCPYTLIVGAASFVYYLGPAIAGTVVSLMRQAVPGISGWHLLAAWALVQIPVFAWSVVDSPMLQVIYHPLSATSRTTVNSVTTDYSEIGINLVGVALALAFFKCAATSRRRAGRRRCNQRLHRSLVGRGSARMDRCPTWVA